jgi:hypothetical protein
VKVELNEIEGKTVGPDDLEGLRRYMLILQPVQELFRHAAGISPLIEAEVSGLSLRNKLIALLFQNSIGKGHYPIF